MPHPLPVQMPYLQRTYCGCHACCGYRTIAADTGPASGPGTTAEYRPAAVPKLHQQPTGDETVLPQVADGQAQKAAAKRRAPINLMRGQPSYDVAELLSLKVPNITIPQ